MKRKIRFILTAIVSVGIANAQTKEITFNIAPDSASVVTRLEGKKGISLPRFNIREQTLSLKCDTAQLKIDDDLSKWLNGYKISREKKRPPTREKYKPEIDRFLNTEDTSVFTAFNHFTEEEIHPRSRDFYRLIEAIHRFDSIVSITNEMKASEFSTIKENIKKAEQIKESIQSYANDEKGGIYYFLSESQQQYYRERINSYEELRRNYSFNNQ